MNVPEPGIRATRDRPAGAEAALTLIATMQRQAS